MKLSWFTPSVGKMNQILHCDWLPKQARLSKINAIWPTWDYLLCHTRKFPYSRIINSLLTNLVRSRWLVIFSFSGLQTPSQSINSKQEYGQYPAILTSCVVNKPYNFKPNNRALNGQVTNPENL